jgi:hypothetical protein
MNVNSLRRQICYEVNMKMKDHTGLLAFSVVLYQFCEKFPLLPYSYLVGEHSFHVIVVSQL